MDHIRGDGRRGSRTLRRFLMRYSGRQQIATSVVFVASNGGSSTSAVKRRIATGSGRPRAHPRSTSPDGSARSPARGRWRSEHVAILPPFLDHVVRPKEGSMLGVWVCGLSCRERIDSSAPDRGGDFADLASRWRPYDGLNASPNGIGHADVSDRPRSATFWSPTDILPYERRANEALRLAN
jgi:hypothetical protein